MSDRDIRIEEFRVRLPAASVEEGRERGQQIVNQIAERLPHQLRPRQLGALELRLSLPADSNEPLVTARIAESVLKALV